jgi:zinc transport system ATP-binding protein
MKDDVVVETKDLFFTYNGSPVLEDVNLTIRENDFVAITGPNGGGKTTLLKLMLGLLQPDRGTIRVLGGQPKKKSRFIGYVPQNVNINSGFPIRVRDIVLMGKLTPFTGRFSRTARDRRDVMDALAQMGMEPFADTRIDELSGGQRQRVFIARALVTQPKLLLLDEPTASIDTKGQDDFYRLLKSANRNITVVVVSHDLLVISQYMKSVACVNRRLHYHQESEITGGMMADICPCTVEDVCPVGLVTPRRSFRFSQQRRKE